MGKKIHAYAFEKDPINIEDSEVLVAVQEFKEKQKVKFPHITDIIAVMKSLGWKKIA